MPQDDIQFGTFSYTDATQQKPVRQLKIQYKVSGEWSPSPNNPIAVTGGSAQDQNPGFTNVTQTRAMTSNDGAAWTPWGTGLEKNYVSGASATTNDAAQKPSVTDS